jgi:hypothetical protein
MTRRSYRATAVQKDYLQTTGINVGEMPVSGQPVNIPLARRSRLCIALYSTTSYTLEAAEDICEMGRHSFVLIVYPAGVSVWLNSIGEDNLLKLNVKKY